MKCLEFRQLALSDPHSEDLRFIDHRKECDDCLKYVSSIRKMDIDLAHSLETKIPTDLVAKLQLNHALKSEPTRASNKSWYAMVASIAALMLVGGLLFKNQVSFTTQVDEDYQSLLAGVVEHMEEKPITPVWAVERANRTINTLLISYDTPLRFKRLDNLQFGRICPMGKYRGLHASLETDDGSITFVFIRGAALSELKDGSYRGFATRVKPLRGGNLVIISHNQKSLEQADKELEEAIYWDI